MALLALAADWSKASGHPPVFAATVDHGLRAASADEALMVAEACATLGIPHATLHWSGAKPGTRIQERARNARYAALCAHAHEIGADTLLTAHHADDQAETILFRLLRGSGIGGLAGMKPSLARDGVAHARPLLSLRKDELVAFCEARGLPFATDPSNVDPRYARTRMRTLAATLEREGMGPPHWARLGARAARAEDALAFATSELRARLDIDATPDCTRFDAKGLRNVPAELVLRLLTAEMKRLGHAPRLERAEPLTDLVMRSLAEGAPVRVTLGGTIIDLRPDGRLTMMREGPRGKAP
ncbi:MAG: tilS [Hyphomicrobiales bacterium]|nr:tilS [Hyphomicrobiales bacterium]